MSWYEQLTCMVSKLHTIDRVLLYLLGFAMAAKLIAALSVSLLSWRIVDSSSERPCQSLGKDSTGKYTCQNTFYKKRNFDHTKRCPRNQCHGYQPEGVNAKEIIDSHRLLKVCSIIIEWVIQYSSAILVIRTLLEVAEA